MKASIQNGSEKILKSTFMRESTEASVKQWGETFSLFSMLAAGGTLLMGPIKWLEDNRQYLSAKIDKTLGTNPGECDHVAPEPKQTWYSVLSGRAASVAVAVSALSIMGPQRAGEISEWMGKHTANLWMKMRPKSNAQTVRKWADLAAFDVLFTSITAMVTYAFSRVVAKRSDEKKGFDFDHVTPAGSLKSTDAKPEPKTEKTFADKVQRTTRITKSITDEGFGTAVLAQKNLHEGMAVAG
jgi:hypothetical protein